MKRITATEYLLRTRLVLMLRFARVAQRVNKPGAALVVGGLAAGVTLGHAWTSNRQGRRLLCLDLDGTTYNSQHVVSRANAEAIAAASRAGWTIAICSGRSPASHLPTARELGIEGCLHLVGCNGAIVAALDSDGAITERFFELQLGQEVLDKLRRVAPGRALKGDTGAAQFVQHAGRRDLVDAHCALESSTPTVVGDIGAHGPFNKITILDESPQELTEAAGAVEGFADDGVTLLRGGPFWCETVCLAHDKAAGVRLLCAHLGLRLADAVAFGDGDNDATMLAACGLGIAMAQGRPGAKRAADRVSRWTNDEDAVAREISALLAEGKRWWDW